MTQDPFHDRLLKIVKSLPETAEDWPWGSIHCKVADKIFVGWGRDESGEMSIGVRTTLELQSMLVASDPRFSVAKYVGKYGGIDFRIGKKPDWDEVEHFVVESYRIIAPKRLVKELDARLGRAAEPAVTKKAIAKKATPKKATAKKATAKSPATKKPAARKPAAKRAPAKR